VCEALLESTRAVGHAAECLIQAASAAQMERSEGLVRLNQRYNDDAAWRNGLISAAQQIAGTICTLVEYSNKSSKSQSDEDSVIVASRNVSALTTHLLQASRSKALDLATPVQQNLAAAAQKVFQVLDLELDLVQFLYWSCLVLVLIFYSNFCFKQLFTLQVHSSVRYLVVAANASQDIKAKDDDVADLPGLSCGIRAQTEQRERIDRLQRELKDAHQDLIALRRSRYKK
jgi:hypothetical protein